MSHITSIDTLHIDVAALDMVPEAVARSCSVLGITATHDTLRVLIPNDEHYDETTNKLNRMLKRHIVIDTADRDAIDAAINFHYPAKHAEIDNCPPQFRFKCPKRWYDLDSTTDRTIRHCNECGQDVFLCRTRHEMQIHAKAGNCVALAEEYHEMEFMGLLDMPEEMF